MRFIRFRRYEVAKRYTRIVDTLLNYEFDHIVNQLGLKPLQSIRIRMRAQRYKGKLSGPERARHVLEELGPTYVKLGQILSMRPDLIPIEYTKEFEKLQDTVAPFDFTDVENVIRQDLGASIEDLFMSFDAQPIAAASIGQVHRARLHDNTDVIVKVQRPDIKKVIDGDLDLMYSFAGFVEEHVQNAKLYRPTQLVDEFSRSILRELDYNLEAQNTDRFFHNFRDDPKIHIPKVYWDRTGEHVLTLEYIKGVKATDFDAIDAMGYDKKSIADAGAKAFLKQVFEDGFFHADIHPGNVLVMEDGRIALLDFGMVGHITDDIKNALVDVLIAMTEYDVDRFIEISYDFGITSENVNIPALKLDLLDLLDKYYGRSLKQLDCGVVMGEIMALLRRHQVMVPSNIALLSKGLITIGGFGMKMVPDFNITVLIEPYAKRLIKKRMRPDIIFKDTVKDASNLMRYMHKMPRQISHILDYAEKGYMTIQFEHHGLNRIITGLDVSSNRLSFSMILSALIIGSALIIQTGIEPHIWGIPALGLIGFLVTGVLGMGLVIYILRTGHI